ncbi:hypothetical protein GCM10010495_65110 [Kitasatospora herbaricolor]|uniref:hypothetical protein n=1 Tax=Kitasatospora herbaricolor TaxID=68217 RepID=UPI00174CFD01|nr:hypothetical protein [Kitasatospora herbaricolor]MDQ0312621.1 hypothetical protein [Kitasatospora herbaricolor]GGV38746.1 hypothetical protein GCM10010495_65110 [Kitasatospora herbaricolor]
MADIEDTPPATQPLPTAAATRLLPGQPTPATLPDPADLRPAGPARRWTWLLGGLTAGAGAVALTLSLVANLVDPAPTATPTAAVTTAATVPGGPPASSGPAGPATADYTTLVDGCALLRPETVERYIKGGTCTAPTPVGGATSSRGMWTSKDSGYVDAQVGVMLSPLAVSLYQQMLTTGRTTATGTGAKITDDRAVPGLGDQATLLYISYSGFGHVDLTAVRHNALVTVRYSASTHSGPALKDVPGDTAEAAAIACAKDVLGTLTTS